MLAIQIELLLLLLWIGIITSHSAVSAAQHHHHAAVVAVAASMAAQHRLLIITLDCVLTYAVRASGASVMMMMRFRCRYCRCCCHLDGGFAGWRHHPRSAVRALQGATVWGGRARVALHVGGGCRGDERLRFRVLVDNRAW